MEISKYSELTFLIEENKEQITRNIIVLAKEKEYFIPFKSPGILPEEIVTETFIKLLILSLQMGKSDTLLEQYTWGIGMLGARGIECRQFTNNYIDYMELVHQVIGGFTQKQNETESLQELFRIMKGECLEKSFSAGT